MDPQSEVMTVRDIRPDGTVLRQWVTLAHLHLQLDPHELRGPWERQVKIGDEEWRTVFTAMDDETWISYE